MNDIREMLKSNRTRLVTIEALVNEDLEANTGKQRELEHALSGLRLDDRSLRPQDVEQLRKCVDAIKARREAGQLEDLDNADIEDVEHFLEVYAS